MGKVIYITGGMCRKGNHEEWTPWLHRNGAIMDARTMGLRVIYKVKVHRVHSNAASLLHNS